MIEIKNKKGEVLYTHKGDSFIDANLNGYIFK